ncbi:MAG: YihY/virulence factor BrkB family protein [Paracoccus sp. (in: a-proteobacteria)]|uniref:YihY/virulence factor BrkB family protein n=2 Tax=Paracoccus sp. TaxID=267 RepID=UPI004058D9AB
MVTQNTDGSGARRSVLDALIGELDDQTRRDYGLPTASGTVDPLAIRRDLGGKMPHLGDLGFRDVATIVKRTFGQIGVDRVTAVAGGVTFFGLLSLFPAITAFVSIYGLVADPSSIAGHLEVLNRFLPQGALDIISRQVEAIATSPSGALSLAGIVGLLVAFYSANGGMKALLSALNVAFFQKETRSFVRLNLVAMGFTLGGLLLLMLMLGVIAVIPILLAWLPLSDTSERLISFIRWPIMFLVLLVALAAVYRWGPAVPNRRWRWISPGAIFAAVTLVVTSILFSWYAANFANYNETYGSLGAVIGLMMWLWLAAMIVLVGAEINSEIERYMKQLAGLDDSAKAADRAG